MIRCSSEDAARELARVLAPENKGAPRDLKLKRTRRGRLFEVGISAEQPSRPVVSAMALLRDVALFQEVWLLSRGAGA